MKKRYIVILIITLLVAFCLLSYYSNQADSIGIIGGADGPSAIFVARKSLPMSKTLGLFTGICIIVGLILVKIGHRVK